MTTGIQRMTMALLVVLGATVLASAADQEPGRPASLAEIQELFQLAKNIQPRSHFVADIELREPAWTAEQVRAELKNIGEFLALHEPNFRQVSVEQSNAVVRSHSGFKLLHVEEWYSGKHYRLDQTDESAAPRENTKFVPGHYHETLVNLRDPEFSSYWSYTVNHAVRDVLLTRKTNMVYSTHGLWEAKGLENEVGAPLLVALIDFHAAAQKGIPADWLNTAQMDAAKATSLHDGNDQHWHLTAREESLAGVPVIHFTMLGKIPDFISGSVAFSPVQLSYWVAHQGGQPVCLQASMTNLTQHTAYLSRREGFADNGFPRVWKKSFMKEGVLAQEMTITFNQTDAEAKFDEKEVFLPAFLNFYMASDVTSGTAMPAKDLFKEIPLAER